MIVFQRAVDRNDTGSDIDTTPPNRNESQLARGLQAPELWTFSHPLRKVTQNHSHKSIISSEYSPVQWHVLCASHGGNC